MSKSEKMALQKSLAFAAAVAALGVSVGVAVENARAEGAGPQGKIGAVQDKHRLSPGASQLKYKSNQHKSWSRNSGATQYKHQTPEDQRGGMHPINGNQAGATVTNSGKVGIGATQDKVRTGAKQSKMLTGPNTIGGAGGKQ